jgi:hypothetical protein
MSLISVFNSYKQEVATCKQYITRAFTQDSSSNYILNIDEQYFIVESAFLRIFIAWETFIENAFISYLLGNHSAAGRQPTRFAAPQSETQAHQMLIGTQRYVDWASPEVVRKLSQIYFDNGEPINSTISSINSDLIDLKNIRNAAAHLSSTSIKAFQGVVNRKLGTIPAGVSVSSFLLSLDPSNSANITMLDQYVSMLDAASYNIVWWS